LDEIHVMFWVLQYIGVVAFAVSGSVLAIQKRMDVFGVLVLAVVTAVGGGVLRDVILGIIPPSMFASYWSVTLALVTGTVCFLTAYLWRYDEELERHLSISDNLINITDALGLAAFVIVGSDVAIAAGYGDNMFLVVFVAVVTGVGGGLMRDMLAGEVPSVLTKRIYALAAIIGASVYYLLYIYNPVSGVMIIVTVAVILAIRVSAEHYNLQLPVVGDRK